MSIILELWDIHEHNPRIKSINQIHKFFILWRSAAQFPNSILGIILETVQCCTACFIFYNHKRTSSISGLANTLI